ncbi:SDR family NAD(P)-dependent oxidoreductase [Microlunatus speluncae]|uniref:SDR family NAD(P)-dependent oxidoreductase n=1 Tax=Microlunatus speluncae TaxID=2594267 RepID=UPI0015843B60|nr:SDR family NAD(P)-dependent oxidoreductase [Microlunatus speluncae]
MSNQSAIVIGAGPGIGNAVAQRFAADGYAITVIARSATTVNPVVDAITATGQVALGLTADSTDEGALRDVLDQAVAKHGVPDVLVYNAAKIRPDAPGELSAAELLDTLAVNVVGLATAAAKLAPLMAERGSGSILITSGMPAVVPAYTSLSLGKAAARTYAELLAAEYGPAGVHVASVVVTDTVVPGGPFDPALIAEVYPQLHAQPREHWTSIHRFKG